MYTHTHTHPLGTKGILDRRHKLNESLLIVLQ